MALLGAHEHGSLSTCLRLNPTKRGVPKSEMDQVSALCNNVRSLPTTVDTILRGLNSIKNRMNSMEDRMSALESTGGFGGGSG